MNQRQRHTFARVARLLGAAMVAGQVLGVVIGAEVTQHTLGAIGSGLFVIGTSTWLLKHNPRPRRRSRRGRR